MSKSHNAIRQSDPYTSTFEPINLTTPPGPWRLYICTLSNQTKAATLHLHPLQPNQSYGSAIVPSGYRTILVPCTCHTSTLPAFSVDLTRYMYRYMYMYMYDILPWGLSKKYNFLDSCNKSRVVCIISHQLSLVRKRVRPRVKKEKERDVCYGTLISRDVWYGTLISRDVCYGTLISLWEECCPCHGQAGQVGSTW